MISFLYLNFCIRRVSFPPFFPLNGILSFLVLSLIHFHSALTYVVEISIPNAEEGELHVREREKVREIDRLR